MLNLLFRRRPCHNPIFGRFKRKLVPNLGYLGCMYLSGRYASLSAAGWRDLKVAMVVDRVRAAALRR